MRGKSGLPILGRDRLGIDALLHSSGDPFLFLHPKVDCLGEGIKNFAFGHSVDRAISAGSQNAAVKFKLYPQAKNG
jgi:hypothetical protein